MAEQKPILDDSDIPLLFVIELCYSVDASEELEQSIFETWGSKKV